MAGTVFTIAQQKGGAGKTTLAAHLALAWAAAGKAVALLDIDPQGSLAAWHDARAQRLGADRTGITFGAVSGWRGAQAVQSAARGHEIVVVDCPPHAETDARIAVRAADLVVVPVQPSPLDLWATRPTLGLAAAVRRPALLVLNRVPPRARLTETMRARLNEEDVPVAESAVGSRVVFADSMAAGLTALETRPRSVAAAEVLALAAELLRRA